MTCVILNNQKMKVFEKIFRNGVFGLKTHGKGEENVRQFGSHGSGWERLVPCLRSWTILTSSLAYDSPRTLGSVIIQQ